MKNLVKTLLLLVCLVSFIYLAGTVINQISPVIVGEANPNDCPPGQQKQSGCVWAQHRITGDCQWLPDHASAQAWNPVPEGTCPPLQPTAVIINTVIPIISTCTPTSLSAATPTQPTIFQPSVTPPASTLLPVDPPQSVATGPAALHTLALTPSLTPPCDYCLSAQRQADAWSTLAAIEATRLYREIRP